MSEVEFEPELIERIKTRHGKGWTEIRTLGESEFSVLDPGRWERVDA